MSISLATLCTMDIAKNVAKSELKSSFEVEMMAKLSGVHKRRRWPFSFQILNTSVTIKSSILRKKVSPL